MKKSCYISLTAVVLSLVAIGFSLFRIYPFEITNDTYIGILVTAMGVCVTFVIGYQIYNVLDLKEKIRKNIEISNKFSKILITLNDRHRDLGLRQHELDSHIKEIKGLFYIQKQEYINGLHYYLDVLFYDLEKGFDEDIDEDCRIILDAIKGLKDSKENKAKNLKELENRINSLPSYENKYSEAYNLHIRDIKRIIDSFNAIMPDDNVYRIL